MNKKASFYKFILILILSDAFFMSCGLDTLLFVDPPPQSYNSSLADGADFTDFYSAFQTINSSDEIYSGTDVYYKIYNSIDTLKSERNLITSSNTDNYLDNLITRLQTTYSYQRLLSGVVYDGKMYLDSNDRFVSKESGQVAVEFRVHTYNKSEDILYMAHIVSSGGNSSELSERTYRIFEIDSLSFTNSILEFDETQQVYKRSGTDEVLGTDFLLAQPIRYNNKTTFDFFDDYETDNDFNVEPVNEVDSDFRSTTSGSTDSYYVQFFAISVGWDTVNLKEIYSLVLDIGSVPITKS